MSSRWRRWWSGLVLTTIATIAVLMLAARGKLEYYVHPRYVWFEIALAAIAGVLALAALIAPATRQRDHGHDHGRPPGFIAQLGGVIMVAALGATLLALPPATLSSATAQQRSINSNIPLQDEVVFASGDDSLLTIKDWAALLRLQGTDFFLDRQPVLEGFVVADPERADVFYVSRFVVTCCAVDAQPVGVPVRLPGWAGEYPVDSWVRVTGDFVPADGAPEPVVVEPESIERIEQSDAPYLE